VTPTENKQNAWAQRMTQFHKFCGFLGILLFSLLFSFTLVTLKFS